jgi:hypothetical protein
VSKPLRRESKKLFVKGVAILNLFLVPIAGLGLYMAYIGKHSNEPGLLVAGTVVTVLSPLLGYLAAKPFAERIRGHS